MKTYAVAFASLCVCGLASTSPSLAAVGLGELAFIGLDIVEDDFAMVALADIQANETIHLTDRDLTAGFVPEDVGTESKEGTIEWVTTQVIAAGEVLLFDGMRGSNRSVRLSSGVEVGQMTETGDFDLAGSTFADFLPLINSLGPLNPFWAVDTQNPENGAFFGDNFDHATSFTISSTPRGTTSVTDWSTRPTTHFGHNSTVNPGSPLPMATLTAACRLRTTRFGVTTRRGRPRLSRFPSRVAGPVYSSAAPRLWRAADHASD